MIMLQDFIDPWTFNQKKVMKCCKEFLLPGGVQVPFCVYNSVGYREQGRPQLIARDRARARAPGGRRFHPGADHRRFFASKHRNTQHVSGSLQQLLAGSAPDIKACCTRLYEHEGASWLPGESFHPGGLVLTGRLGQLLELAPVTRALDVACGDVIGPPYLTHVAEDQAGTVAANVLGSRSSWNPRAIPSAIFTDPEIATAGMNEDEAQTEFARDLEILRAPCRAIDRAVTEGRDTGSIKVLLVPGWNRGVLGGEVVGAHVIGERAGEIVQQFAFLMRWRLPLGLLAKTVQSYPTYGLGARQAIGKHWLDPQARWGSGVRADAHAQLAQ